MAEKSPADVCDACLALDSYDEDFIMANDKNITLSVIKADVGGFVGHSSFHPALLDTAKEKLSNAKSK